MIKKGMKCQVRNGMWNPDLNSKVRSFSMENVSADGLSEKDQPRTHSLCHHTSNLQQLDLTSLLFWFSLSWEVQRISNVLTSKVL